MLDIFQLLYHCSKAASYTHPAHYNLLTSLRTHNPISLDQTTHLHNPLPAAPGYFAQTTQEKSHTSRMYIGKKAMLQAW